eukprot:g3949.t1
MNRYFYCKQMPKHSVVSVLKMSFTSGKQIRDPEVQVRILQGNLDYERHERERLEDENRRLREQLRQANQGKRNVGDSYENGDNIIAAKGAKIRRLNAKVGQKKRAHGPVKVPERPVAILIGNRGSKDSGIIYGDRDMEQLEKYLKKWLPSLEDSNRILKLQNCTKESVSNQLNRFVGTEKFKMADFVLFACSAHGLEFRKSVNKTGRSPSAIEDCQDRKMLLEGSNQRPGIIDVIEHHTSVDTLRCYILGKCREEPDITIDKCYPFGTKELCQQKQKSGICIAHACGHRKRAESADDDEELAPWLASLVKNVESTPGNKLHDALANASNTVWKKSFGTTEEQLPEIFQANFSFPDGASVVFKAFNSDLVDDNDEEETDEEDEMDLLPALDFMDFDWNEQSGKDIQSHEEQGEKAMASGDYINAIEHFTKLRDALVAESGGEPNKALARSLARLGNAYGRQGMYPKSMECLEKALEVQLKELGEEHATVADTYEKLGWTCSQDGKHDKAMEYQQKGLSIRLKVYGGEDH